MATTSPITALDTQENMEEKILTILSEYYPDLDCGPGTPVYEMVVRPMAYLWSRQSTGLEELIQSVSFTDYLNMAEEDLNRLMNRYFLERRTGTYVEAIVRCTTKGKDEILIYAGEIWETSDARTYEVQNDLHILASEWNDIRSDGSPLHWTTTLDNVVIALGRLETKAELDELTDMKKGDCYIVTETNSVFRYEENTETGDLSWVEDTSITDPILYKEVPESERKYFFDVTIKSVGIGSGYNAYQLEEIKPTGLSSSYITSAYFFTVPNDGGTTESNYEFYNRAKNELAFRGMCSYKSTSALLLKNFDTINEVVSIGLKDDEMIRDLVQTTQPSYNRIVFKFAPVSFPEQTLGINPAANYWYEYDEDTKTYKYSTDTVVYNEKRYFLNVEEILYTGSENPSQNDWYEYDTSTGCYFKSSDQIVNPIKHYYENLYSPILKGWYEKDASGYFIESTDTRINLLEKVYWKRIIIDLSTHMGGRCDLYIKPNTYYIEHGYTAPLGFPISYLSYSLMDTPNSLMNYWNSNVLPDLNKEDGTRGSLYENLGSNLTENSELMNLHAKLDDIETFVNNGENTSLHTDNLVKQMWPIVTCVNIQISCYDREDVETVKDLAKTTIKTYINSLSSNTAPQIAELAHILRSAGIKSVHIPSDYQYYDEEKHKYLPVLRAYYLRDSLKMEWIGLNYETSGTSSQGTLLIPLESDSLKFKIDPAYSKKSQMSLRTCTWYTNPNLINVEVV